MRQTRVVLAAAHLDHNPSNNLYRLRFLGHRIEAYAATAAV